MEVKRRAPCHISRTEADSRKPAWGSAPMCWSGKGTMRIKQGCFNKQPMCTQLSAAVINPTKFMSFRNRKVLRTIPSFGSTRSMSINHIQRRVYNLVIINEQFYKDSVFNRLGSNSKTYIEVVGRKDDKKRVYSEEQGPSKRINSSQNTVNNLT